MLLTHAMAQARTEAPSEQRSAEAHAFGHVPRTVLVGVAVAFASSSALLSWLHRPLANDLAALLRAPLLALARSDRIDAAAHLRQAFFAFAPQLMLLLLGAGVASALSLAIVQGFRFRVLRAKPRHPFAKPASSRAVTALLTALGTALVIALGIHDALWTAQQELAAVFMNTALRLSIALLLIAACDAALARAAFWRSLWMTRQQRRDEDRQAFGSPEMKTERERARRELGRRSS
jgi:flagellar biosynthesis protein FlhB